jgi:tRNA wybutosine-synthesizing protein 5
MFAPRASIPRVPWDALCAEDFRAHFARRAPLVLTGLPVDPAAWTPAALRTALGDVPLPVTRFEGRATSSGTRFESLARETVAMRFDDFLAARDACAARALYLRLTDSAGLAPALFARVPFPDLFTAAHTGLDDWITHDSYLRVGPSAYGYPLHCDGMENLFVQLAGHKRFVLIEPAELPRLYPHPDDAARSLVDDVDAPDLARFPDFAAARQHVCDLVPGDLLYLPALWFHEVRARGWSASASRYFKRPQHTLYVRGLKPRAWRDFEAARGIARY